MTAPARRRRSAAGRCLGKAGKGPHQQLEILLGIHPPDGDEAAHSVCLAFHGAKQFSSAALRAGSGMISNAPAVDFEAASISARIGSAMPTKRSMKRPRQPQPPAEGGASKRRQVLRRSRPSPSLHSVGGQRRPSSNRTRHRDHGAGVARAKQDVGLVTADGADQAEHHPQGLERRGEPARPGEIVNQIVRRVMMLRTAVAPHGDADVLPRAAHSPASRSATRSTPPASKLCR